MAIYRLFQNNPMQPEDIRRISDAYELTLKALALVDRNDLITELIAKKIIEIGQTGLKDPTEISARAMDELGVRPERLP